MYCSWSANQILGQPKVYPQYGDLSGVWAQGDKGQDEYIEVSCYKMHLDMYNKCLYKILLPLFAAWV